MGPDSFSTAAVMRSAASASERSASIVRTGCAPLARRARAASRFARLRDTRVTFAPSSTNACAQASPMPLLPPVTTTMRSRRSRSIARLFDALAAARGRDRGPEPQQVAVDAEAGDLALRDSGDHRVMAPFLPGVDVGHVPLDDRARQD